MMTFIHRVAWFLFIVVNEALGVALIFRGAGIGDGISFSAEPGLFVLYVGTGLYIGLWLLTLLMVLGNLLSRLLERLISSPHSTESQPHGVKDPDESSETDSSHFG